MSWSTPRTTPLATTVCSATVPRRATRCSIARPGRHPSSTTGSPAPTTAATRRTTSWSTPRTTRLATTVSSATAPRRATRGSIARPGRSRASTTAWPAPTTAATRRTTSWSTPSTTPPATTVLFCDGVETCDPVLDCQAGPAPVVDDGIACTDDSCDEATDVVVHAAEQPLATTGCSATASRRATPVLDCQAGPAPVVDDGVACTDDSCDEANDVVVHAANHAACDNAVFCDGAETCDPALDCRPGRHRSSTTASPARTTAATRRPTSWSMPSNHAACDNGVFCDGVETCDPGLRLPGRADPCNDGVACTNDSCDEATDVLVPLPPNTPLRQRGLLRRRRDVRRDDGLRGRTDPCNDGIACTERQLRRDDRQLYDTLRGTASATTGTTATAWRRATRRRAACPEPILATTASPARTTAATRGPGW